MSVLHICFFLFLFSHLGLTTSAGSRTDRLVNPLAWRKGTVFVQCKDCDVWHNIRDEAGLIKEYRLNDDSIVAADGQESDGSQGSS